MPALRKELADFSNPPFFLCDGSQLLRSLSSDPADRKIILAGVAHSHLLDLQLKDYFLLVHSMVALGEDTTAAAFHILAQPKFQVFIPQHALTLAQDYCLVYMLLPTNQDFWIQPAIQRLHAESDVIAQNSLLLLLWYAQTADSDKALAEFSSDPSKPEASKTYASELLQRSATVGLAANAIEVTASEESLRQARRERMKAVSDEALEDLDSYTAKIIAKREQSSGSRKTQSRPDKSAHPAATLEAARGANRAGNSQKFSAGVYYYKTFWNFFCNAATSAMSRFCSIP